METTHLELDHRSGDGVEVGLWWERQTDRLTVTVVDLRSAASFELDVEARDALDVFHHPYAYAARADRACRVPA